MCNRLTPSSKGRAEPAFGNFMSILLSTPNFVLAVYSVVVLSEFAELKKVQRPNLWPDDYSFMRMSR